MPTRRDFLKGLFSAVASAALVKNGVVQPQRAIGVDWAAEGADRSVATVFDMAQNTWRLRSEWPSTLFGYPIKWIGDLSVDSPIMTAPLGRVNHRFALPRSGEWSATLNGEWKPTSGWGVGSPVTVRYGEFVSEGVVSRVTFDGSEATIHMRGVCLDNLGISHDTVAKRIEGLQTRTERIETYRDAVLENARRTIDGTPS